MLCKYSNFTSLKENIGQTFLPGRKVWRNLSLQKGKLDRNSTDTQMSWCRGACANCQVLTPDKQVSRGDICLHNMCCTAKLFWFYYGSRISPITLIFLLRVLATRRWRSLRIPWALHAHLAICSLLAYCLLVGFIVYSSFEFGRERAESETWVVYSLCSRISLRARCGQIARWACNAHGIRKLRHLRVAKARSKKSVRSVRSVSFNIIIVLPNNNVYIHHTLRHVLPIFL